MLWPRDSLAGPKEHVGGLGLDVAAPPQLSTGCESWLVHITNTIMTEEDIMLLALGISSFLAVLMADCKHKTLCVH